MSCVICIYGKKGSKLKNIQREFLYEYLSECVKRGQIFYDKQFLSYFNLVNRVRKFKQNDVARFFSHVLPWKLSNPSISNSKELCLLVFDNKEEADKLYQTMLIKNPYYQHGSELSPFSSKHKRYQHLSEEEKEKAVSKFASNVRKEIPVENSPLHIEYYIKQGMSEGEAQKALKQRQCTFSLEKCIEKYGEEEGTKKWKERQKKWMTNFKKQNYSLISQMLFWEIYEKIKNDYNHIYFATLNANKEKDYSGKNHEYIFETGGTSFIKPDFIVRDIGKIIEFDGDYWHGKGKGNRMREQERDKRITDCGYYVYHVKEFDFKNNPEETIKNCINFLKTPV